MNAWWTRIAARINALSERERIFLFLSIVVSLLALADTLWLTPAQRTQKELLQKFASQAADLDRLRVEVVQSVQVANPGQQIQNDVTALQAQLDASRQEINQLIPSAPSGPALERVLVEFLRKQEGLTLLAAGTLKDDAAPGALATTVAALKSPTDAAPAPVPVAATAPATPTTPTAMDLTRRGMELRVAGPYPSLIRYVKSLETALPQLRWGEMQLKANKTPPELTLTVYVLGVRQ